MSGCAVPVQTFFSGAQVACFQQRMAVRKVLKDQFLDAHEMVDDQQLDSAHHLSADEEEQCD
jgi:hypothetical protein